MEILLLPLVVVALLFLPLIPVIRGIKTGKKARNAIILNLTSFFAVMAFSVFVPFSGMVQAAETTVAADGLAAGLGYLAAALVTGLACIGCGIAVAAGAPAAIGATAEEPKSFAKSLIFVALGEGIGVYGLLISIMILGKL